LYLIKGVIGHKTVMEVGTMERNRKLSTRGINTRREWLADNWYVPIVCLLDLAIIWRL
jgi:hypothetical protein